MMLQIRLNHLLRHLTDRRTKITSRPKMSSPVPLLQRRKLLEPIACRASLDPPHDFPRGHLRRSLYQDVNMILADHGVDDTTLERISSLAHQHPDTLPNVAHQRLVPRLRHRDE